MRNSCCDSSLSGTTVCCLRNVPSSASGDGAVAFIFQAFHCRSGSCARMLWAVTSFLGSSSSLLVFALLLRREAPCNFMQQRRSHSRLTSLPPRWLPSRPGPQPQAARRITQLCICRAHLEAHRGSGPGAQSCTSYETRQRATDPHTTSLCNAFCRGSLARKYEAQCGEMNGIA